MSNGIFKFVQINMKHLFYANPNLYKIVVWLVLRYVIVRSLLVQSKILGNKDFILDYQ